MLASLAGVSARTVFAIETEGRQPTRAVAHVLAEALGIEIETLFPGRWEPARPPAMREVPAKGGERLTSAQAGRAGSPRS
jgi:DNA-binding XRE family transcriptional regulator